VDWFRAEDGARLAYRDEGEGLPVLALAGLTRDGRDFDYLAHHLYNDVRLVRLDCRGRGGSDWTGPATYTVPQEARDAVALLDHLGINRAAIIGSSRGGMVGMVVAATAKQRMLGLCLNDVGPVLERRGLERIATYVGVQPAVSTLEEIADRLPTNMPGFAQVPDIRWAEEAIRHFVQKEDGLGLTYDPSLRQAVLAALAQPLPEMWPLFDACEGLPLALIRAAASDVLSAETAAAMQQRRPDMLFVELPDRGHVPFLDETEALTCIAAWLDRCRAVRARSATEAVDAATDL
jgi:pimeloyl-ACP methyl ester carboxylesterase